MNYLRAHLLCQNLETVRRHRSHILCEENNIFGTFEGKALRYLVQGVVGGHGHSVSVQHEPLSQESKEAVCVHDLHLPPVDKHRRTHIMVKCLV